MIGGREWCGGINTDFGRDIEIIDLPAPADLDTDADGVPDSIDRCFGFPDGTDRDGDQIPDGCDPDSVSLTIQFEAFEGNRIIHNGEAAVADFQATVSNIGLLQAHNVSLILRPPLYTEFISGRTVFIAGEVQIPCSESANMVTCSIGDIDPNQTQLIRTRLVVGSNAPLGPISFVASVDAEEADRNNADNRTPQYWQLCRSRWRSPQSQYMTNSPGSTLSEGRSIAQKTRSF